VTASAEPSPARGGHAWQLTDVTRLYALNAVGFVTLLTCWWAAAGSVRTTTQIACIAVGIAALTAIGTANCLWLLTGRRSIALRRRAVRARVDLLADGLAGLGGSSPAGARASRDATRSFAVLPGSGRYHRSDCDLLAGKAGVRTVGGRGELENRRPCGVCEP
jgi:hypothetical protein